MFNNRIWDFWADGYEKLWVQKYSLGPTRREIISELDFLLKKGKKYKILDMGCGTGQLLREIQMRFEEFEIDLTGVDISHNMIKIAKEKSSTINYINCDIELFDEEECFDIILCTHSFPYYMDKPRTIEKFFKLINVDGYILLAQASQNNLYDRLIMSFVKLTTSNANYPSVKELLKLMANRFKEVKLSKIKERFYMPSIYLFIGQKYSKNEVKKYEGSACKT